jgi:hypothetical protein
MRLITKICGNYRGRGALGIRVFAMNSDTALVGLNVAVAALEKCE